MRRRRSQTFKDKFEELYGPGAMQQFMRMYHDPLCSKADIGRYFGFTREYARQVIDKLGLSQKRERVVNRCKTFSWGKCWFSRAKEEFTQLLKRKGFVVTRVSRGSYIRVNDKIVRLLASKVQLDPRGYKFCPYVARYDSNITIFILQDKSLTLNVIVPTYLLPVGKRDRRTSLLYPITPRNKWYRYINKFDLL